MKPLQRSARGRQLGGVASGLAQATGIDVSWIRLGLVVGSLASVGSLPLIYLALWMVLPDERDGHQIITDAAGRARRDHRTIPGSVVNPPAQQPQQRQPRGSVWEQPYDQRLQNPDDLR